MRRKEQYKGFSLAEVLIAVGTLAIGMIFIGGTFLTGVYFSTLSTERTIAASVADEAFAKIRLYGIDPADTSLTTDQLVRFETLNTTITDDEFAYPSTKTATDKQYFWSALCRSIRSDSTNHLVQVTVFASRKIGSATTYPGGTNRPVPVQVGVSASSAGNQNQLTITTSDEQSYINGGCTIVNNETGILYRVIQRDADSPNVITLDKVWSGQTTGSVWVIPPPIGGGKAPCIAVFQKLIRF
jgi:Tfp pilus assembly protein PilV